MKLELEVTGGFTGPAGKQLIRIALDQIPAGVAADIQRDLGRVPETAWGCSFMAAHPKSWDFKYVLRMGEGNTQIAITFHKDQGPPELSRIAGQLIAFDASRDDSAQK